MRFFWQLLTVASFMTLAVSVHAQNNQTILFENGSVCVEYVHEQDIYIGRGYLPNELKLLPTGSIVGTNNQHTVELARLTEEDGIYSFIKIDPMGNVADTLGLLNLEKGIVETLGQPGKEDVLVEPTGEVIGHNRKTYLKGDRNSDVKMLAFLYLYTPMAEFEIRQGF